MNPRETLADRPFFVLHASCIHSNLDLYTALDPTQELVKYLRGESKGEIFTCGLPSYNL